MEKKYLTAALITALILGTAGAYATGGAYIIDSTAPEVSQNPLTGTLSALLYGGGLRAGQAYKVEGRIKANRDSKPIQDLNIYVYILPDRDYKTINGYNEAPSDEKSRTTIPIGYVRNDGVYKTWAGSITVPPTQGRYSIIAVAVDAGVMDTGQFLKELDTTAIDGHPIIAISSRGPKDSQGATEGIGVESSAGGYNVGLIIQSIGGVTLLIGGFTAALYIRKKTGAT